MTAFNKIEFRTNKNYPKSDLIKAIKCSEKREKRERERERERERMNERKVCDGYTKLCFFSTFFNEALCEWNFMFFICH